MHIGANTPGGDDRTRTDDLLLAKQALSQLSYIPNFVNRPRFSVSVMPQNQSEEACRASLLSEKIIFSKTRTETIDSQRKCKLAFPHGQR